MPSWIVPVLKAILPHVGSIVSATAPVFTKKSIEAAANQAVVLQQQITELQTAAAANDAHIKELAAQLQQMVTALEENIAISDRKHRRMLVFVVAAVVTALVSLGAALFVLAAR